MLPHLVEQSSNDLLFEGSNPVTAVTGRTITKKLGLYNLAKKLGMPNLKGQKNFDVLSNLNKKYAV